MFFSINMIIFSINMSLFSINIYLQGVVDRVRGVPLRRRGVFREGTECGAERFEDTPVLQKAGSSC